MTVSSQTSNATFMGNGVATEFPLPFRFFNNSDICAYFIDSVTGAATQMVLGADYTLIGAGEPEVDGNALSLLTTTVPLASMRGLYVERVMQQVQETDIVNQGQFFASTHEDVFDRLTMLIQQVNASTSDAIRVAIGDPTPTRLPPAPQRALKLMSFDADGNPVAIAAAAQSATDLELRLAQPDGAEMSGYGSGTVASALDGLTDQTADLTQMRAYRDLSPLYLEQFLTGHHGRGMLTAEAPSVVTQQALAASAAADDIVISPTDASSFDVGGSVTVLHDNGRYWTYFITAITSNLAILPALKWPASIGNQIERTWYNQAHPGKFYMRQLAQRIAHEPQYNMQLPPTGRVIFSQLDSSPTDAFDTMTGFNGGVVSYVDESNLGQGVISKPVESNIGRAVFVSVTGAGQGAETQYIPTNGEASVILRFVAMARSPDTDAVIRVVDDQLRVSISYHLHPGASHTIPQVYTVPMHLYGDAKSFKVQIYTESAPAPDSLILDQFEIFRCAPVDSPAIAQDPAGTVVVGFGDSWISGDEISTPERESILTQLAIEIPEATIINKGVGGNTIVDLLARFDSDVVPLNPDYVIVNTGTNDSYNPSSGTFFPNSVDNYTRWMNELISRIMSIGARPIIIGLPALAESDGAYSAFALNDRAKTYSRYLYKRLGQRVVQPVSAVGSLLSTGTPTAVIERGGDINTTGSWVKHADGRLECQRLVNMDMTTLATQSFSFPIIPVVGTAGGFRSLRGLGSSTSLTADAAASLRVSDTQWEYTITASAGSVASEAMMLTMVGRWF